MKKGPSNDKFFTCRDKLRTFVPEHPNLGLMADLIFGACLGALISTFSFPINTLKTLGGEFQSVGKMCLALYRERGVWGVFRGVHVN